MKNNKKKITFQPGNQYAKLLVDYPRPATHNIPDWYRSQKIYSNGENNTANAYKKGFSVATYKACTPLIDTMTSGYVVTTPADIMVLIGKDNERNISWNVSWNLLDVQDEAVLGNYPIPHGYSPSMLRWYVDWIIETPPGYSLWITHPSHRYDLPFLTINGFVDTDKYPNKLIFPFFLKDNFEGIIEKGTPIAQIFPIKREHWITNLKEYNPDTEIIERNNVKLKMLRSYKNFFWSKKKYE
jgi:hypothetical protein